MLILLGCGSVAVAVVGLPGSGRESVAFGAANWLIIAWGWGIGVVMHAWDAFFRSEITEDDVDRELARMQRP